MTTREKIKINKVRLQSIVIGILSNLGEGDALASDAKYHEVNWPYAIMNVYEQLLLDFEPVD